MTSPASSNRGSFTESLAPGMSALKSIDQFKMVSKDLTQNTMTGGIFTAIAYASLTVLLVAETSDFFRTAYTTQVVMDENRHSLMRINFDITLLDLPCRHLKLHVFDKFGEESINTSGGFQYLPVDHTGSFKGQSYSQEELAALEQADVVETATEEEKKELDSDWSSSSDSFKHQSLQSAVTFHEFTMVNFYAEWCVHCRQFYPVWQELARTTESRQFTTADGAQVTVKFLKINCVDFMQHCQEAQISAFPTIRMYKRDGSFKAMETRRNMTSLINFITEQVRHSHQIVAKHHNMFTEGCQVKGDLLVPRVPGHFHLQAEAFRDVQLNPAITNVSHVVNHLSFGEKENLDRAARSSLPKDIVKHLNPLDGQAFVVQHFHEAPQHYLKVVSTHVEGKNAVYYQMTHTDRTRHLRDRHRQKAPQARFSYDFSPMSVVVKAKRKRWYEFLTSMFAILGGTYTILELCSGAVDSVNTAVKEALGKAA